MRGLAGPGVAVHPVVKANAYGHGAVEIATALAAAGVEGFCVATADEALQLRRAGVAGSILVLYPVPAAIARELARRHVAVTAGDLELLAALTAATDAGTGQHGPAVARPRLG
ncbi:MAG TPA: alanine racemase, partial [Candidatus Acidoferrales bacterium]|nr:alanine racemase [Candidatus Acidoferrales bacterium]